jgi:hypothetical protein
MQTDKAPDVDITKEVAAAVKALAPAVKRLEKALRLDLKGLDLGPLADYLYDLRQAQHAVNTVTAAFDDVLPPVVKTVEEHFIQELAAGESSGVQGRRSRVQVTDTPIPQVADWPKFYQYIKRTGAFELLNRAVNRAAVAERWDQKKQVPGVTVFHAKKVSCTKLNGKGGK